MKFVGVLILALGIALLAYVLIGRLQGDESIKSPVPEPKGIKIIYLTPTPKK